MRGFRIGRVFGIDLRIDWSWLVIFALLTWNLVAVFSSWHPDWSTLGVFLVAVSASLVFFGCVLLHELAHAIVAMSYGVPVRSITLFLFGGVSNIEQEPPSARMEFFMAIAGPITSIAIGLGALFLTSLAVGPEVVADRGALGAFARLGPLTTLIAWLGPINIMIGVFNLLPAFPLDGGRILRSAIWGATGNLRSATQWAAGAGRTIGWLLIGAGIAMTFGVVFPVLGTGFANGLWMGFIGWFLHSAATQATTRLALDDAFAGITVAELMQRTGPIATPRMTVAELVQVHLLPGDDRALPVVDHGAFLGLVSIADVRGIGPERWATTTVADVMRDVGELHGATPDEPLVKAFEELARYDIEQLPVVDRGQLVGMLRRRDIARWLELAWKPNGFTSRGDVRRPVSSAPPRPHWPFHGDDRWHHHAA